MVAVAAAVPVSLSLHEKSPEQSPNPSWKFFLCLWQDAATIQPVVVVVVVFVVVAVVVFLLLLAAVADNTCGRPLVAPAKND